MSFDEMVQRDSAGRLQVIDARSNPEQECSINEARVVLAQAIDRLGPLYSEVLHMFHMQELSAKEAARILGVPEGTVKARLHRRDLGQAGICSQCSYADGDLPLPKMDALPSLGQCEPSVFEIEAPLQLFMFDRAV